MVFTHSAIMRAAERLDPKGLRVVPQEHCLGLAAAVLLSGSAATFFALRLRRPQAEEWTIGKRLVDGIPSDTLVPFPNIRRLSIECSRSPGQNTDSRRWLHPNHATLSYNPKTGQIVLKSLVPQDQRAADNGVFVQIGSSLPQRVQTALRLDGSCDILLGKASVPGGFVRMRYDAGRLAGGSLQMALQLLVGERPAVLHEEVDEVTQAIPAADPVQGAKKYLTASKAVDPLLALYPQYPRPLDKGREWYEDAAKNLTSVRYFPVNDNQVTQKLIEAVLQSLSAKAAGRKSAAVFDVLQLELMDVFARGCHTLASQRKRPFDPYKILKFVQYIVDAERTPMGWNTVAAILDSDIKNLPQALTLESMGSYNHSYLQQWHEELRQQHGQATIGNGSHFFEVQFLTAYALVSAYAEARLEHNRSRSTLPLYDLRPLFQKFDL